MAFKLNHENENGSFKIKINRVLTAEEMDQICKLADNLLSAKVKKEAEYPWRGGGIVYGPQNRDTSKDDIDTGPIKQTKIGERPVSEINMGTYVEPNDGVRLKILNFVELGRIAAIKTFRSETGISTLGCKDIVYGNFPCPILSVDVARGILEKFKELGIYAKIVPAYAT